ncbi:response regulator [Agaribacterium haliotis]|uniref:response regulator n=1 Tax=Agaribacterium haliotis TaxID=2013869 RepID=UPI000BB54E00|nr:response regulator [Agaribacterium haliotis]
MSRLAEKFANQTLAQKLLLIALLLGTLVAIAGVFLQTALFRYEFNTELRSQLEQAVRLTSPALIHHLDDNDPEQARAVLRDLAQTPVISEVRFLSSGSWRYYQFEAENPNRSYFISDGSEFRYQVKSPHSSGQAQLLIQAHPDPFLERSSQIVLISVAINVAIIFLIAIGMLLSVRKLVLVHLDNIANYARHLGVDNLSEALRLNRPQKEQAIDELDHVVDAFEQMRTQLIQDLDQRRAMELALMAEKEEKLETRKLIESAKASDRAKSQFIATMSHEIRTPMNGVMGMVEMLRGTELDQEQQHYVEVINRSGESLMTIINDILDYSKIEAGKLGLEYIEYDLYELVGDCIQLFSGNAQGRNIALMANIAPDTPRFCIGDPTRLRQVLVNLIGNAFKFTEEGSVFIEVGLLSSPDEEQHLLHFSVGDSGIGIEPEVQESIFEAFKQADSSTTRRFGGTGLGLAICRQLVELMDGRLGLHSEPDHGSTFWFTIRSGKVDALNEHAPSCSLALSNKRLLYVHPTDFMDEALRQHAAQNNLRVLIYRDADIALAELRSGNSHIDFILLSQSLNGSSGLHIAHKIRELDAYFETPIIMLTNEQSSSFSLEELMPISSLLRRPCMVSRIIEVCLSEASGISLNQLMPTCNPSEPKKVDLNVLVAEDNIVNRMVIEGLLEKLNIKPDFSEDGLKVVERYCKLDKKYDLIFMDCEMPNMDGFEATLKIRRWESDRGSPHVPIIALTAHVEAEHRQRVHDVGMNYYVSKPVTLEKISEALSVVGVA